jgi:hypothetical protein
VVHRPGIEPGAPRWQRRIKSLTGYIQFTALHITASTFLYETLINRSTLLGAERLQATLAVAFQEVLCLLAFVLAAFPLGFCTFFSAEPTDLFPLSYPLSSCIWFAL